MNSASLGMPSESRSIESEKRCSNVSLDACGRSPTAATSRHSDSLTDKKASARAKRLRCGIIQVRRKRRELVVERLENASRLHVRVRRSGSIVVLDLKGRLTVEGDIERL